MIITKKALPRRALLQGVGASLALPLLDAMIPAMTALAATPAKTTQRLGYIYVPMGSNQAQWTPAETGKLSRLSPTMHSLSPFLRSASPWRNSDRTNWRSRDFLSSSLACSQGLRSP